MSTRLIVLAIGLLFTESRAVLEAQSTRAAAQAPPSTGTLRGRTQIPVPSARMPNLVGQSIQSAQDDSRVSSLKLQLDAVRRPTKDQRPGTIVDQEPPPGSVIKPGMRVTVYVAVAPSPDPPPDESRNQGERGQPGRTQPDVARMPNLVGQSFDQAQQDSLVVKLKLRLVPREQPTNGQRPGVIIGHDPEPGDRVRPGSSVVAVVAVAPPQRQVDVPRVVPNPVSGVRVPLVIDMEVRQGIAVISKSSLDARAQAVDTDRAPPGTIIDQNPKAGTLVVPPFTVIVFVSRRPPVPPPPQPPPPENVVPPPPSPPRLFPMPDLIGRSFPVAERDTRVTDLQLRLNQQVDTRAGGLPNTIVRQSVPAGTNVSMGQAVTVFVASGVAVPRVVQQQADAAAERIVAEGLNPRRSEETSEVTPGTVLRQVPEPGILVARGASVGITVAVPPKVVIPNVVGRTRADAIQELTRWRLRPNPVDDGASPSPPEQVVSQVPEAGAEAVIGAAVRISVATGVEVPDLSGLSAGDAQRAVAERGLSFEDTDQESDAAAAGRVFQQQPLSGTRVTRGSRVLATVAVPVRVLVPSVVGMTRQRAAVVLEAAGLRANPEPDAAALSRLIVRQQPNANERVVRLTNVALFVAAAPPPPVVPPPGAAPPPPSGPELTLPPAAQAAPPGTAPGTQPGVVEIAAAQPSAVPQGGAPAAAQSGAGTAAVPVAIPVQPLLPPWLLSLLVALAAIGASTFRLWWPNRPPAAPPIQATPPAPPPAVDVRPELGTSTLRLEVAGRSLISLDVRLRVGHGSAEHTLSIEEQPFIVEERRLYE